MHYHLISRCVRRSWLCGRDPHTGKNYDYRKTWVKDRLFHLAQYFAVGIEAYTILDNHFHMVIHYDPKESQRWDDHELVSRWTEAFPPKTRLKNPEDLEALKQLQRDQLLTQPDRLREIRNTLGSVSYFMKYLKQPIAWRANQEDKCKGHFFEKRFYSGALLSEEHVIAAMAYVDLNPVRAKIARRIQQCRDSSIFDRLSKCANTPERLKEAVEPLVSGINTESRQINISLQAYVEYLTLLTEPPTELTDKQEAWIKRVSSLRKRRRAYGPADKIKEWMTKRGWHHIGHVLAQ